MLSLTSSLDLDALELRYNLESPIGNTEMAVLLSKGTVPRAQHVSQYISCFRGVTVKS